MASAMKPRCHGDNTCYGFQILAPKHDWPHDASAAAGWKPGLIVPLADRQPLMHIAAPPARALRTRGVPSITTFVKGNPP